MMSRKVIRSWEVNAIGVWISGRVAVYQGSSGSWYICTDRHDRFCFSPTLTRGPYPTSDAARAAVD